MRPERIALDHSAIHVYFILVFFSIKNVFIFIFYSGCKKKQQQQQPRLTTNLTESRIKYTNPQDTKQPQNK